MMSIEASLAANRRTSCSRWASASVGSVEIEIEYRPLEAAEHFCARCACAPLSGLMYQVRALALVPLPQAVSSPAATSNTVPAALERRRRDLLVSTARTAPSLTPDSSSSGPRDVRHFGRPSQVGRLQSRRDLKACLLYTSPSPRDS